jgi:hypothetical protein
LKNAYSNPLIEPFRNMLAEDGKYPAKHVDVFWNQETVNGHSLIKDVEVVFAPKASASDPDLWNRYRRYNKIWSCDYGNSISVWLEDDATPAGLFGDMLRSGFLNAKELENALREFSHIVECNWAREMLSNFEDRESFD